MKECTCGRSPTGQCCGWHSLSQIDYEISLAEHELSKEESKDNNSETE